MTDTPRMPQITMSGIDTVDACLTELPTAALLAELDAIVAAIDSSIPSRQRQRSGFFGRLLGRDLVAMATSDEAEMRVKLHLAAGSDIAKRLADQATRLEVLVPELRAQAGRLRVPVIDADEVNDPQRRAAMATNWEAAATHVELVHAHAMQLLRRHAHVREVLVPAWRQHLTLAASGGRNEAASIARLGQTLREQLAAFHATTPRSPSVHDPRHHPALAGRDAHSQELSQ